MKWTVVKEGCLQTRILVPSEGGTFSGCGPVCAGALLALAAAGLLTWLASSAPKSPTVQADPPTVAREAAYWREHGRPDLAEKARDGNLHQPRPNLDRLEALECRLADVNLAIEALADEADEAEENRRAILALAKEREVKP